MGQTCACVHHDAFECVVQRYAGRGRSREQLEQEARECGGCDCACHGGYDEDSADWYDEYQDGPAPVTTDAGERARLAIEAVRAGRTGETSE